MGFAPVGFRIRPVLRMDAKEPAFGPPYRQVRVQEGFGRSALALARMVVHGERGALAGAHGLCGAADSQIRASQLDESRLPGKRPDASGAARGEGTLSRIASR